jgi:hypothetical protein
VEKYVEVKNRGQEEEESCMYCLRLEVEECGKEEVDYR